MEIETFTDSTDGTHHIVLWIRDQIRTHDIYLAREDFETALAELRRRYPTALLIQSDDIAA